MLDILDRLGQALGPRLGTVDENYGQLGRMFEEGDAADDYPLRSPAALVDAQGAEWSDLSGGAQAGTMTVVVTLALDCYDDTHLGSGPRRERIAERMGLMAAVCRALHGWKPRGGGRLSRRRTRLYHLPRLWKAYELTFTLAAVDPLSAHAGEERELAPGAGRRVGGGGAEVSGEGAERDAEQGADAGAPHPGLVPVLPAGLVALGHDLADEGDALEGRGVGGHVASILSTSKIREK